jgi:hypothetical protein
VEIMNLGKGRLTLSLSTARRRIRLGVSHSGSATTWVAPAKDRETAATAGPRPGKQKRR